MTRLLLAGLLATTAFSAAHAADLPRRGPAAAPVFASAPIFTWTGFYVGLNAGAGWGEFTKAGNGIDPKAGFVGGLQVGYNQQFGQFVAGLEADYNFADLKGRNAAFTRGELNSFGTIRGRLGVAFDRALVYATGGYALGNAEVKLANGIKDDKMHSGYTLGGGLEYAFTPNISMKAEYLWLKFEDKTYFSNTVNAGKAGLDANVVRAGLNYRF
jgi:outer membrane immunogenic protein